jgi:hypothetical protein
VEQIVESRQVGKKKTLQYKIHWKGYSQAHDSWEPAAQVHASELIRKFQKTKSSQKNNATINYQLATGIPSRPKALTQPRAYSSLTEAESSKSHVETDKGSKSGKRTQDSPIVWMGNKDRRSSSNSDKKGRQDLENIIAPAPFHINSCIMENHGNNTPPPLTVEEVSNLDLADIEPTKIYDELIRVCQEAQNSKTRRGTYDLPENNEVGPFT